MSELTLSGGSCKLVKLMYCSTPHISTDMFHQLPSFWGIDPRPFGNLKGHVSVKDMLCFRLDLVG